MLGNCLVHQQRIQEDGKRKKSFLTADGRDRSGCASEGRPCGSDVLSRKLGARLSQAVSEPNRSYTQSTVYSLLVPTLFFFSLYVSLGGAECLCSLLCSGKRVGVRLSPPPCLLAFFPPLFYVIPQDQYDRTGWNGEAFDVTRPAPQSR